MHEVLLGTVFCLYVSAVFAPVHRRRPATFWNGLHHCFCNEVNIKIYVHPLRPPRGQVMALEPLALRVLACGIPRPGAGHPALDQPSAPGPAPWRRATAAPPRQATAQSAA